uniref:Uncharacterized protein n=1 Tax=Arundo donax TaxID=35708 RepID=A0A0A9HN79_ARUDO
MMYQCNHYPFVLVGYSCIHQSTVLYKPAKTTYY